jgi:hypothetical protein
MSSTSAFSALKGTGSVQCDRSSNHPLFFLVLRSCLFNHFAEVFRLSVRLSGSSSGDGNGSGSIFSISPICIFICIWCPGNSALIASFSAAVGASGSASNKGGMLVWDSADEWVESDWALSEDGSGGGSGSIVNKALGVMWEGGVW